MKSNAAAAAKSSAKDRANEKTYRIPLSNGILEHCPDMLDSVWLFIWYIDTTTKEKNGEGTVLGGIPIGDPRPAAALRMPVRTIRRWRQRLEEKGYIRTVRTPYGHVVTLLKSKKWDWGPKLVGSEKEAPERELPKREFSTKENCGNGHREFPKLSQRTTVSVERIAETVTENSPNGKYKEDKAVDSTGQDRDEAVERATAAAALLSKIGERMEWKDIDLAPCGSDQFQKAWKNIYGDSLEGERHSDVMERCIIACKKAGIIVPRAFYEAKRRLENNFSEDRSGTPSQPPQPYADDDDGFPTHEVPG
jgi:hypothetical protein